MKILIVLSILGLGGACWLGAALNKPAASRPTVTLRGKVIECENVPALGPWLHVDGDGDAPSVGLSLNTLEGCDAVRFYSRYEFKLQSTGNDHYNIVSIKELY